MNLAKKLKARVSDIERYKNYAGILHHMELEGPVSNRMMHGDKEQIVWCLNDYLGAMNDKKSKDLAASITQELGSAYPHATRATFGHTEYHQIFEKELAEFSQKESAFLLNLGYAGICSVIDALTDRHDTVIYDQKIHACSIDGVRLHNGRKFAFKHNSITHLETQLKRAKKRHNDELGSIILMVDGVYSMHGEQAPLKEIVQLKKKYDFTIILDDSHGFGVLGQSGAGAGQAAGVQDEIDIYISTFTKALGSLGAFVAGDSELIDYLRYNTRSQIFSRTIPLSQLLPALNNLRIARDEPYRRTKLWENTKRFQNGLRSIGINIGEPQSPITPIRINGTLEDGLQVLFGLREKGVFSYIVSYPVVAKGTCLIRMVSTFNHTNDDIDYTLDVFRQLAQKYPAFLLNESKYASLKQKEVVKPEQERLTKPVSLGGR